MRHATFVKNLSSEHLTAKKERKNKELELVSEEVKPGNLHHDWNHHQKGHTLNTPTPVLTETSLSRKPNL